MSPRLQGGLVSVTFRALSPREICDLAAKAGLEGIEWGGDVHAPAGDLQRAREIRGMSDDLGLSAAAYGSYFRIIAKDGSAPSFAPCIETALELGAPTVRIWAGTRDPADADAAYVDRVIERLSEVCDEAAAANLRVALEFHGGTLTGTTDSTLEILRRVPHPALDTLWQPPVGMEADECEESLQRCLPRVSNVHVFHWGPHWERYPLASGSDCWRRYVRVLESAEKERFLLLEFVQGDDPVQFLEDARTLDGLIAGD